MEGTQQARWLVEEVQGVLAAEIAGAVDALCAGDLRVIEARVQPLLRRVGGALLAGLARLRVAAQAGERPVCACCGGALRLVGERSRTVVGLVGEVTVRRPYYHCAVCHHGQAPLDVAWGLGRGRLRPELTRVVCRAGIEAPFAQAADLVCEHLGVRLDAEQVRAASAAMGAVVEGDQQDPHRWALPPAAPAPEILLVELDGVLVHLRAGWREVKLARVAPLGPGLVPDQATGETQLALGASTYAVGLAEADRFWPRAMREVVRAGWGRGGRVVVLLGDGADWIWRAARTQLRRPGVEVVEIVDFFHACEHLATAAAVAFGAGSGRAAAWLDRQRHALRHRGPTPVRRALATLVPPSAAAADEVRKAGAYFRTHAHRMRYPAFRARHFPIGSGAIESTAKNLVQARQVLAGMRWSEPGAQDLASLRALHRSGRWPAFWRSQPQRRLLLLRPRQPWSRTTPSTQAVLAPPPASVPAPPPPAFVVPPTTPTPPPQTRIQTVGKPWAKGTDYWRRAPIRHPRPPTNHARSA